MDFYTRGQTQDKAPVVRPRVHEILYGIGPNEVGKVARPPDIELDQDFRWIHLPANNVIHLVPHKDRWLIQADAMGDCEMT